MTQPDEQDQQGIDQTVTTRALQEAQARYSEQGSVHDKATSEVSLWMTVAGVVLGALTYVGHATFHESPAGFIRGWRLLGVICGLTFFTTGAFYLRRFFLGRDITYLGDPQGWLEFLTTEHATGDPKVKDRREQELAIAYARVAAKRFEQNKIYLREQRSAKAWIAWSALTTGVSGLLHILVTPP